MLASTLMTICNLSHFHKLMKDIRDSLEENKFEEFVRILLRYEELKKAKTLGFMNEAAAQHFFSIYYAFSFFPFCLFCDNQTTAKKKKGT